jgi:hypothetical protein
MLDYDNLCEAAGLRIQDGDHLVRQVIESLQGCKTPSHAIKKATQERSRCVREEKYLTAFLYDTAIRELSNG